MKSNPKLRRYKRLHQIVEIGQQKTHQVQYKFLHVKNQFWENAEMKP